MDFQTLRFQAMGCPCEILLDTLNETIGAEQLARAIQEAKRIEQKYSRYVKGNIVDKINTSLGACVEVDDETSALLDFAAEGYAVSNGLFDITTGALRRGADLPASRQVSTQVGWEKVIWKKPFIQLPEGFEIDLGGICKEYAADRILELLISHHSISTLVNLGGDIAAAGRRVWSVGIEDVTQPGHVARLVPLQQGAIATSGTAQRGGHILNPHTGNPVENPPASVTVTAKTCTEAGFWSTLAMLHGVTAERFLKEQCLEFWSYRPA